MKNFLTCAAMAAMMLLAWSADGAVQAKRGTPVKKGTSTAATKGKKKYTSASSKSAGKSGKKTTARHPATTWRNRQLSPSADRYREIQQALASKGYMKSEDATGAWNSASTDALKRFQSEQNLDASGKINSLSLIALGLGPKREQSSTPQPINR